MEGMCAQTVTNQCCGRGTDQAAQTDAATYADKAVMQDLERAVRYGTQCARKKQQKQQPNAVACL
jgi:hypothetical protein